MASIAGIPVPLPHLRTLQINPRRCFTDLTPKLPVPSSLSSTLDATDLSLRWSRRCHIRLKTKASISEEAYTEEAETKVKFPTSLSVPGCSSTLFLLGTGFREKVFAIIGVKVYAAGFYANPSILASLVAWKGVSAAEIHQDPSLFNKLFNAPDEKSLHIALVRDVDGKTFWDALDEAVTPRITSRSAVDESALSKFRSVFQGRSLKTGTSIFMTWLDTAKMLISISSNSRPSSPDATIESPNVTFALFDVFLGGKPVSPTLKASVSNGLAAALK